MPRRRASLRWKEQPARSLVDQAAPTSIRPRNTRWCYGFTVAPRACPASVRPRPGPEPRGQRLCVLSTEPARLDRCRDGSSSTASGALSRQGLRRSDGQHRCHVFAKGWIDADNLFVCSGVQITASSSAWIVARPPRFRAAVSMRPVVDWHSGVRTTDARAGTAIGNDHQKTRWNLAGEIAAALRRERHDADNGHDPARRISGRRSRQSEEFYRALKMLRKARHCCCRDARGLPGSRRRSRQLLQQLSLMAWFKVSRHGQQASRGGRQSDSSRCTVLQECDSESWSYSLKVPGERSRQGGQCGGRLLAVHRHSTPTATTARESARRAGRPPRVVNDRAASARERIAKKRKMQWGWARATLLL